MKRNQFTFYRSYWEAIQNLPPEDGAAAAFAIFSYALDEVEPELNGVPKAIFSLVKPTLDAGRSKAENRASKNKPESNEEQTDNKTGTNQKQNENKPESNEEQTRKEKEREKEREKESYKPPNPLAGELFNRFWASYPRKTAKRNALRAFEKLNVTEALLTEMLAALDWQRHSEQWTKDNGSYIPHPATWLNGRRWEDEQPGTKTRTLTTENGETIKLYD